MGNSTSTATTPSSSSQIQIYEEKLAVWEWGEVFSREHDHYLSEGEEEEEDNGMLCGIGYAS